MTSSETQHGNRSRSANLSGRQITPQLVLRAIGRWWMVAIPIQILLATLSAALVYVTFQPSYEASVLLRISSEAPFIVFSTPRDSKRFVLNQVELIKSELVLGPLVEEFATLPELADAKDPVAELVERVAVSAVGDSDLFRITYTGHDPKSAAAVANAISAQYFLLRDSLKASQISVVIQLLEDEKMSRELRLKTMRQNARQMAKNVGVNVQFGPDAQNPGGVGVTRDNENGTTVRAPNGILDLQQSIARLEVNQLELQGELKAYQNWAANNATVIRETDVELALEQHPELQFLQARISANNAMLRDYDKVAKKASDMPSYRQLQRQIEGDQEQYDELMVEMKPQVTEQLLAAAKRKRELDIAKMQTQMNDNQLTLELFQERYNKRLQEMLANRQQVSGDTLELEFKLAEVARANEVLNMIESRAIHLKTEQRAPDGVEELLRAQAPGSPVTSLPYKQLMLVVMASLCIPLALAVAWEWNVRRINNADQLKETTSLEVVGEITSLPVRKSASTGKRTKRLARELSLFEESVDTLRTTLILSKLNEDLQVVAVTSPLAREGKTSIASQLTVSIAQASGQKTLLIDGDLRSPDIHNVFDIDLEPGLADVLEDECNIEDAIVSYKEGIDLLPAGRLKVNPHKLCGNGSIGDLLEKVRDKYRYIVVDTPPALAAGEAMVIAKAADATLVCAMRDSSRVNHVRAVHDRLERAQANPVGVVLNGVPTRRYVYSYGYYDRPRS